MMIGKYNDSSHSTHSHTHSHKHGKHSHETSEYSSQYNRHQPEYNPLTFLSCTNEDKEVEWAKDVEEIAPYCAELDDYHDECKEVLNDQGAAFPFTRGFYLIAEIVAAMCPEDLDAMDESVPFTKAMLDNLLGIQYGEKDYERYFNGFVDAQHHRKGHTHMDKVRRDKNWKKHYHDFLKTPLASDLATVKRFKEALKGASIKDAKH